ncbi:MAG TPA: serine hydrolase [Opitutaceae bacterium]|nr:serine hydrolase [Opitutaceae bacterium]
MHPLRFLPALAMILGPAARAQGPVPPSDAEIRRILQQRIETEQRGVGLVVGLISPEGRRIVAYGRRNQGDPRPLDGDTEFEIGSVTKVFTSLVLMEMAQKGEVSLDDPVVKYLPSGVRMPERDGRDITLRQLSNQTSGLPRMPGNFHPRNPANPYADYSAERMYAFLSGYALPRDPGMTFEYSNLGVGLLGEALSHRAGLDYGALVAERVLRPLGLKDTGVSLAAAQQARLAAGHDARLRPTANWDLSVLAGAGALRSTANDLLTFLGDYLGLQKSPLASAMAEQLTRRLPIGSNREIAYGWFITRRPGREIIWHNGKTGGYRSFLGFDPAARLGVVVLSNAAIEDTDDLGNHLLDPSIPLSPPPRQHQAIALAPAALERFAGVYEMNPAFQITFWAEGGRLYSRGSGQSSFEVFPEGPADFFAKVADISIHFETDGGGAVTAMVLLQNGRTTRCRRIPAEAGPKP